MPNLANLKLFIRISETAGIGAAARSLGITTATASAAVKRLERQLGSQLFNHWPLFHQGRLHEVPVSGDRAADDGALVRKWALQGCGIAYKSRLDIHSDLAAGRLIDLFPQAKCEQLPLYALDPSRKYQPARLKALLQFFQEALQSGAPSRAAHPDHPAQRPDR